MNSPVDYASPISERCPARWWILRLNLGVDNHSRQVRLSNADTEDYADGSLLVDPPADLNPATRWDTVDLGDM